MIDRSFDFAGRALLIDIAALWSAGRRASMRHVQKTVDLLSRIMGQNQLLLRNLNTCGLQLTDGKSRAGSFSYRLSSLTESSCLPLSTLRSWTRSSTLPRKRGDV